jgi:hypothetical protein
VPLPSASELDALSQDLVDLVNEIIEARSGGFLTQALADRKKDEP